MAHTDVLELPALHHLVTPSPCAPGAPSPPPGPSAVPAHVRRPWDSETSANGHPAARVTSRPECEGE